jgi:hypothetical protein
MEELLDRKSKVYAFLVCLDFVFLIIRKILRRMICKVWYDYMKNSSNDWACGWNEGRYEGNPQVVKTLLWLMMWGRWINGMIMING